MEETLRSLFLKLQDVVHRGCVNSVTKEGAKNFLTAPGDLAVSQKDKNTFKSLLSHVEETTLKPWSDNQAEFLVLTRFEDDNLNSVNYMSVLRLAALGPVYSLMFGFLLVLAFRPYLAIVFTNIVTAFTRYNF